MKKIIVFLLCIINVACVRQYPVRLGDTLVKIRYEKHGEGKSFIHVHQNETTALQAARSVIKSQGGSIITLVHPGGGRNIEFNLHHKKYEFDPNRIFTDQGIRKTLAQYSQSTPEGQRAVKRLAQKIKALLPRGKVIAVHNNETYSLHDYLPGHTLADDAKALHVDKHQYFRNFFLVTQRTDYVRLKNKHYNSIWQALGAADDGSLSIFLANGEYINVEAGYDQLQAQIKMLKNA